MRRKIQIPSIILIAILLVSCTPKAAVPGSINNFDATAYANLLTIQAAINSLATNPNLTPALKPTLNSIIAAYNLAQDAYKTYHTALVGGGNPDTTALGNQISSLISSIAAFTTQLKGGS